MFNLSLFNQSPESNSDIITISKEIPLYKSEILNKMYKNVYTKSVNIGYINNINSINKIKNYGSYIIIINSQKNEGPSVIYCISRSNKLSPGNINKLSYSEGINKDSIELEWNPGEYPLIKYNYKYVYNSDETNICKLTFLIKII
jgi:hypothetical protein